MTILRFRRQLSSHEPSAVWPPGVQEVQFTLEHIEALHAILAHAYRNGFGEVPATSEAWWAAISQDAEFDPTLIFVAADGDGQPVGGAQCWSSGFIKDIAVAEPWRGLGIGAALLQAAFKAFAARGAASVDLKVQGENTAAIRLYRHVGMVEATG